MYGHHLVYDLSDAIGEEIDSGNDYPRGVLPRNNFPTSVKGSTVPARRLLLDQLHTWS